MGRVLCQFCEREFVNPDMPGSIRQWFDWKESPFPLYWCDNCRAIHETPIEALQRKFQHPYVDLKNTPVDGCIEIVGEEWIRKKQTVPFEIDNRNRLSVAMINPLDFDTQEELINVWRKLSAKGWIGFYVCDQESFDDFLLRAYPKDEDDTGSDMS